PHTPAASASPGSSALVDRAPPGVGRLVARDRKREGMAQSRSDPRSTVPAARVAEDLLAREHGSTGSEPLRDRLCLEQQQEVIAAAGLAVGSREVEAAKRLNPHQRAG